MARRPWRLVWAAALAAWCAVPAEPSGRDVAAASGIALSSELRVEVRRGREIELEVLCREGDDYGSIAARVTGDASHAAALEAWNGSRAPAPGSPVRVPFPLLGQELRRLVLVNLFPEDRRSGEDWVHVARSGVLPIIDEGLWQIALWFTGRGENFGELMRSNGLGSPEVRAGQTIVVPAALLLDVFRAAPRSDDGSLEFGSDSDGPYAAYVLRPGEALYSAVVLRFTGRTSAEDVNALAEKLRERNGIHDARDIPAGSRIKIPLDLLEPEHLPPTHPRRLEAEAAREALAESLARQPIDDTRNGLEGVLVILDPGHGGRDLGTMHNGVWEHDYVYDVVCRVKRRLERETAARVALTMVDEETGCVPSDAARLDANRQGTIQTTPPFLAVREGDATIGVNLRWYLANSLFRKAVREGHSPERVVFLSVHADSRHPGLRGAMVYVPGAAHRTRTYGFTRGPYSRYAEVREKPHVRFSKQERIRSEAVSRRLADSLVDAHRRHGLPVQSYKPVRDAIIRGKATWLPAVLRGNEIPSKVLIEILNLSNADDARLLGSATDRERLADAIVDGLLGHFGEDRAVAAGR